MTKDKPQCELFWAALGCGSCIGYLQEFINELSYFFLFDLLPNIDIVELQSEHSFRNASACVWLKI